jgi:hypothetical protein
MLVHHQAVGTTTTTTALLFLRAMSSQAFDNLSAVSALMEMWSCCRSAALPERTNCGGTCPFPS